MALTLTSDFLKADAFLHTSPTLVFHALAHFTLTHTKVLQGLFYIHDVVMTSSWGHTRALGWSRPALAWQLVKRSSQAAQGLITEQWWKVCATGRGHQDGFNSLTYYGSG